MIYPNMSWALKNEEDPHRGHQQVGRQTSCCREEVKQVSFPLLEQSKRNHARFVLTYILLHQRQSTRRSQGFLVIPFPSPQNRLFEQAWSRAISSMQMNRP